MAAILDQTGDTTRQEIHTFARLYDFPDYVKQASPTTVLEKDSTTPSTAFADVRNRQFKCATKAATWMSYLFFLEKSSALHPKIAGFTQERLDAFANQWGIAPDIAALQEKHASLHKDALSDSSYMIVWASDDGGKDRRYPLRNAMEVKVASDWFMEHRDHFPYQDRRTMATRLLEKANEYGVGLDEDTDDALERQVGRGTFDPKTAAERIRERVLATDAAPEIRDSMTKLAASVRSNPHLAQNPESVVSLCATIDQFDRLTKLASSYSDKIPRPEDIFCAATWKTAKAAVNDCCTLITGTIYHQDEFQKLALGDIRDAFGDSIADAVATGINVDPIKMAEVGATLPLPDAQMFTQILADRGVHPLMKQASAVHGPSFGELQHLARVHDFVNDLPARDMVKL